MDVYPLTLGPTKPATPSKQAKCYEGAITLTFHDQIPPIPDGFVRVYQSFQLSPDKRTLLYKIVDEPVDWAALLQGKEVKMGEDRPC